MCRTLLINLLLATSVASRSLNLARDLATVQTVVGQIDTANVNLRQSISDITLQDTATGNVVLSQAQLVEEAMRQATTQIQAAQPPSAEELPQLEAPLEQLAASVSTTMTELTAIKPQLDQLGTTPEIAASLQAQRAAAGELGDAITTKLPAEGQALAAKELPKVLAPIDQAIAAFGGAAAAEAAPAAGVFPNTTAPVGGIQQGGVQQGGVQQVPPQLVGGQQQAPVQIIGQQQAPVQVIGGAQQFPQQNLVGAQQGALPPGTVVVVQQPQPGVLPGGVPNQPIITQQRPVLVNTANGPVLVQPIIVQQPPTLVDLGNGQGPVLLQAPPVVVAQPVAGQVVPGQVVPGQVVPGQIVPGQVLPPGQLMAPPQVVPPQQTVPGQVATETSAGVTSSTSSSSTSSSTTSAATGAAGAQKTEAAGASATTTRAGAAAAETSAAAKKNNDKRFVAWRHY